LTKPLTTSYDLPSKEHDSAFWGACMRMAVSSV
jgi:hypothetical protein